MSIFQDIKTEVNSICVNSDKSLNEAFCEVVTDRLRDAGVIDDFIPCHFDQVLEGKRIKIDGYSLDEECTKLELFISHYDSELGDLNIKKLERKNISLLQKLASQFYDFAIKINRKSYNEESELFQILNDIKLTKHNLESLRVHILADGHYSTEDFNTYSSKRKGMNYTYTCELWDATSLKSLISEDGRQRNAIEIDLNKFSKNVPCLKTSSNENLETYLATFPGDIIAEIYNRYEFRLLENNVRVFLQSKGKVNKGIKETIANEPEKFISFNNGLSVTVEDIELERSDNDQNFFKISKLIGLQIVNGGQTTATIREAYFKDEEIENVRKLSVPVKINLIKDKEKKDHLITLISRYANTQNGIKNTDIQSSHPYHTQMEIKSKTIRGPFGYWFYERLRGSYNLAVSRSTNQSEFRKNNPKSRLLTKEYVTMMYYCVIGNPYLAVKGPQNLSLQFLKDINDKFQNKRSKQFILPDDHFYKIIAAYIVFKKCMDLQKIDLNINMYNPFVAYYTVAYVFNHPNYYFDHMYLFKAGEITEELNNTLLEWLQVIRENMEDRAKSLRSDFREYFKKDSCWDSVKKLKLKITKKPNEYTEEEKRVVISNSPIDKCMEVDARVWKRVILFLQSKKSKTKSFQSDLEVCKSLYDMANSKWKSKPSENIASIAMRIFDIYASESEIN
ncbi:AIPR family protein [Alphaproteobacteria bacterium]|nr:AIPR family protein [Alphaproteobacteria bacterium]